MKAYFSLMECQTMMLLKSSFEDMPKIRSALDKIVKHFKRHSTELEQLFEARLYTRNCLHLRQGFFKLMIIFHTKYDFNRPKVSEFEFKLQHRIPMLLVVNSGLVANKQFVGKYNEENKFLCCFMPNTKEELCSEDMLQNLRQMAL